MKFIQTFTLLCASVLIVSNGVLGSIFVTTPSGGYLSSIDSFVDYPLSGYPFTSVVSVSPGNGSVPDRAIRFNLDFTSWNDPAGGAWSALYVNDINGNRYYLAILSAFENICGGLQSNGPLLVSANNLTNSKYQLLLPQQVAAPIYPVANGYFIWRVGSVSGDHQLRSNPFDTQSFSVIGEVNCNTEANLCGGSSNTLFVRALSANQFPNSTPLSQSGLNGLFDSNLPSQTTSSFYCPVGDPIVFPSNGNSCPDQSQNIPLYLKSIDGNYLSRGSFPGLNNPDLFPYSSVMGNVVSMSPSSNGYIHGNAYIFYADQTFVNTDGSIWSALYTLDGNGNRYYLSVTSFQNVCNGKFQSDGPILRSLSSLVGSQTEWLLVFKFSNNIVFHNARSLTSSNSFSLDPAYASISQLPCSGFQNLCGGSSNSLFIYGLSVNYYSSPPQGNQIILCNEAPLLGDYSCPPGEPLQCPAGNYCPSHGFNPQPMLPIPCPANTFNPIPGQFACQNCPAGTTSPPGSTSCN